MCDAQKQAASLLQGQTSSSSGNSFPGSNFVPGCSSFLAQTYGNQIHAPHQQLHPHQHFQSESPAPSTSYQLTAPVTRSQTSCNNNGIGTCDAVDANASDFQAYSGDDSDYSEDSEEYSSDENENCSPNPSDECQPPPAQVSFSHDQSINPISTSFTDFARYPHQVYPKMNVAESDARVNFAPGAESLCHSYQSAVSFAYSPVQYHVTQPRIPVNGLSVMATAQQSQCADHDPHLLVRSAVEDDHRYTGLGQPLVSDHSSFGSDNSTGPEVISNEADVCENEHISNGQVAGQEFYSSQPEEQVRDEAQECSFGEILKESLVDAAV